MNFEYCDGYTYTIKNGDTLYEISRSHKVPLSLLLRSNPFVDVFNLQVGDTLCIPTRQTPSRPCEIWGNCEENSGQDTPGMQGMPGTPGRPGTPSRPGTSSRPGMQVMPRTTDMPENSEMTEFPDASGTSDMSNGQGRNNTSGMPDISDMPENPELRGTQQMPQRPDASVNWERYVVKPGDTIGKLLDGKMSYLEAFGEKNGWDRVYLLPGVAYFVPEGED